MVDDAIKLVDDTNTVWVCPLCMNTLKTRQGYERHVCSKPSPKRGFMSGEKALYDAMFLYGTWCRITKTKNRIGDDIIAFTTTKGFHKKFVDLVEYVNRHCYDPVEYLRFLVSNRVNPSKWCSEDIRHHEEYLRYHSAHETPIRQAIHTREVIQRWVDSVEGRTFNHFYDMLTPSIIASMLSRGLIKEWPVMAYAPLTSKLFTDGEYAVEVLYAIDVERWQKRVANNPEAAEAVRSIMEHGYEYGGVV